MEWLGVLNCIFSGSEFSSFGAWNLAKIALSLCAEFQAFSWKFRPLKNIFRTLENGHSIRHQSMPPRVETPIALHNVAHGVSHQIPTRSRDVAPKSRYTSTGLEKRFTVHLPAGVRGTGKPPKSPKINLRNIRFSFWGFSCSNWGFAAHFLVLGGGWVYLILIFKFFPRKNWEKSGPPSLLLSPAKSLTPPQIEVSHLSPDPLPHFPLIRSRQGAKGGGCRAGLVEGIAALLGSENGSRYRGVSQLQWP